MGQVQDISPPKLERLLSLYGQLLQKNQEGFLVPARENLQLGSLPRTLASGFSKV